MLIVDRLTFRTNPSPSPLYPCFIVKVCLGFNLDNLTESMEEKGQKALFNPICALAFIYRITSEEIILNVLNEGFWEECKNKLWMSMISKHSSF